ncbi:MAG: hypothetical protein ABIP42_02645, partial [Planctomycetota bacterium]
PKGALAITTRADLCSARGSGPAIAAGPDPFGAVQVVARVMRKALDLPERGWEPGAGVPFESWMEPRLMQAARSADAGVIDELLAPR